MNDNTYQVRFVGDSNLTFVNYGVNTSHSLPYRQEARLHNVQRRISKAAKNAKPKAVPRGSTAQSRSLVVSKPATLLDPLSTSARDPFHRTVFVTPQAVERSWYASFTQHFGLPRLESVPTWFPDPSKVFLHTARAHPDLYRSIVIQSVVITEAESGKNNGETVFHNQALILRDFRKLVEIYDNTAYLNLTKQQFEHIFASGFSLSGRGFHQEAGYNAIMLLNSLFMQVPYNLEMIQTPFTEWLRMLLPRAGPSCDRTPIFQLSMLAKVNSVLEFLRSIQDNLLVPFSPHVSHYIQPNTPIYTLVKTDLPADIPHEPYKGFYLICFHRIASILHRHFAHFSSNPSPEDENIVTRLETMASRCLKYSPTHRITLFLWCLLSDAEVTGLYHKPEEAVLPWAMKDLVSIHNISFIKELVAWLICKSCPTDETVIPFLDIEKLQADMQLYYATPATQSTPSLQYQ